MKLTLMETIDALLKEGSICVKENKSGTKRTYTVMQPHPFIKGACRSIGKTTVKTLETLLKTDFILPNNKVTTDKYGNKSWHYESNIKRIDPEERSI